MEANRGSRCLHPFFPGRWYPGRRPAARQASGEPRGRPAPGGAA